MSTMKPLSAVVDIAGASRQSSKWSDHPGHIGAGIAESDFGTAPEVTAALHDAIDNSRTGYLPMAAYNTLVTEFVRYLALRYHWEVSPASVRLASDVHSALEATLRHFTTPQSAVIVATPAYAPFLRIPHLLGRRVIEVPMITTGGRYQLDLNALTDAYVNSNAELLVLCNPHNPTGTVLPHAELVDVANVVDRHHGRVFADEIWAPVVPAGSAHIPYASLSATTAAHTITATAPSKGWNLSGVKCAQVVLTNLQDQQQWDRAGLFPPYASSILGVLGSTAAYSRSLVWLDTVVSRFRRNQHALSAELDERAPGLWPVKPDSTYLAWLDFTDYPHIDSPAEELKRRGLVVNDGATFGQGWSRFVRVNLALSDTDLDQTADIIVAATR